MSGINIVPLIDVPLSAFMSSTTDSDALRNVRLTAKRTDGFFLLRQMDELNLLNTFRIFGGPGFNGRWHLGKISADKGIYHLHIRRSASCFYGACFNDEELSENVRFMKEDGDRDVEGSLVDRSVGGFWDVVTNEDPFVAWGMPSLYAD